MIGLLLALTLAASGCERTSGAATSAGFSLASIKGTYASLFSGHLLINNAEVLFAGTGIFRADGKGHVTGRETFNVGGQICADVAVSGTYTVNTDGTGTDAITFSSATPGCSGTYQQSLVISDGGKVIRLSNTSPNQPPVVEEWRAQSAGSARFRQLPCEHEEGDL
jgi:hypothetical protein